MSAHTIVHLTLPQIVNVVDAADRVERAFELFEHENRNKLHGLPHDMDGAQQRCDRAVAALEEAVAPRTIMAMAVELLAARNAALEAELASARKEPQT